MRIRVLVGVVAVVMFVAVGASSAWADTPSNNPVVGSGSVLRAQFNENTNGAGHWLFVYGSSSCTATYQDWDYALSSMPPGWDNAVSKIWDYNRCDVDMFGSPGFGDEHGWTNYTSNGNPVEWPAWNDRMSSFAVS